MLAVSSLRNGTVTSALKEGTGSAVLNPSGLYTGSVDKEFIVECDSIGAGAEVGQATIKWSSGAGAWEATGVTTSASNMYLSDGVYINFSTGSGADFVVGDKWYLKGINLFNPGKMVDSDRDHRYRSAALDAPNTITISLGSALDVMAIAFFDHNLSSAATINLKGHTADSWGDPDFTEAITWSADKTVHFLDATTTYRYWQPQITDAANSDGHIEVGELFIGPYMELSRNYSVGFSEETEFLMETNVTPYGIRRHRFYNTRRTFNFDFNFMIAADVAKMKALITAISNRSTGTFKPFFFIPDSASPNEVYLVEIASLPVKHVARAFYDMPLVLSEILTSV